MPEIVLASFNSHAGVQPRSLREAHWLRQGVSRLGWSSGADSSLSAGGDGAQPPPAYDLVSAIVGLDADIVVVQEAFRPDGGDSALDEAASKLGYELHEVVFGRAALAPWPHLVADGSGQVGLAVLSRFPVRRCTAVPVRPVPFDPAPARQALHVEVDVAGRLFDVVGVHLTSRLPHGPPQQLRHLRSKLPHVGRAAVLAGDFNFWGPPVVGLLEGWRRAVRGRTWPAERPRNQIDHVLVRPGVEVLGGEVLDDVGSDHRPVRAHLRLP